MYRKFFNSAAITVMALAFSPVEGFAQAAGANAKKKNIEELRTQMESAMGELSSLASQAESEKDIVKSACVMENRDRAKEALELGTTEILTARDPSSGQQQVQFATEKLQATVERMQELVDKAKSCRSEDADDFSSSEENQLRNSSDEPRSVPIQNPASGQPPVQVVPPVTDGWPPASSPID